jgi:hypothetical protein
MDLQSVLIRCECRQSIWQNHKNKNGEHQWTDPLSGINFIQLRMKKIFPIQKTEDAHDAELQYLDDQTKSIVLEIAENATKRADETQP